MMMEKYRTEVRRFYLEQKAAGVLLLNLTYATTSKLRDECLMLFSNGCSELDLRTLKSFLGRPQKEQLHESAIRRMDTDKFKALTNFLKKEIKTTEKNFELLAWLVDFKSRPYSKYILEAKKKSENIAPELKPMKIAIAEERLDHPALNFREIINDTQCDSILNTALGIINGFDPNYPLHKESNMVEDKSSEMFLLPREVFLQSEQNKEVQQKIIPDLALDRVLPEKITLEYPSGVKLSLHTADFALISKLVKL